MCIRDRLYDAYVDVDDWFDTEEKKLYYAKDIIRNVYYKRNKTMSSLFGEISILKLHTKNLKFIKCCILKI